MQSLSEVDKDSALICAWASQQVRSVSKGLLVSSAERTDELLHRFEKVLDAFASERVGNHHFASLTGLNAHQIFMPTIVMLHMSLVTAIGALACNSNLSKNIIYLSMLFVALSPLTILGTIFQLIAQESNCRCVRGIKERPCC